MNLQKSQLAEGKYNDRSIKIGKKVIFVGFPRDITFENDYPLMGHHLEMLESLEITIPIHQNWEICKNSLEKEYSKLCEFISYHDFVSRPFDYFTECEMLILFSKVYNFPEIQEDECISTICLHNQYTDDGHERHQKNDFRCVEDEHVAKHVEDILLSGFDSLYRYIVEAKNRPEKVIKSAVNKQLDYIYSHNKKCQFCLMPLSSPELDTSESILTALDYKSDIKSRDFDYFNLSFESSQRTTWRDDLSLSDIQYDDILNSVRLISSDPGEPEMIILPHTPPGEFEGNIVKLLYKLGYETKNNFYKYKKKTFEMYEKSRGMSGNKITAMFPMIYDSRVFSKLHYTLNQIDKNVKMGHVLITGEAGVGKEFIAYMIGNFYKYKGQKKEEEEQQAAGEGEQVANNEAESNVLEFIDCREINKDDDIRRIFGYEPLNGCDDKMDITEEKKIIILDRFECLFKSDNILFLLQLSRFMQEEGVCMISRNVDRRTMPCKIIAITNSQDLDSIRDLNFDYEIEMPPLNRRREDISRLAESFCDKAFSDIPENMANVKADNTTECERVWKHLKRKYLYKWENDEWENRNIRELKRQVIKAIELHQRHFKKGANPIEIGIDEFLSCLFNKNPKDSEEFYEFYDSQNWDITCTVKAMDENIRIQRIVFTSEDFITFENEMNELALGIKNDKNTSFTDYMEAFKYIIERAQNYDPEFDDEVKKMKADHKKRNEEIHENQSA